MQNRRHIRHADFPAQLVETHTAQFVDDFSVARRNGHLARTHASDAPIRPTSGVRTVLNHADGRLPVGSILTFTQVQQNNRAAPAGGAADLALMLRTILLIFSSNIVGALILMVRNLLIAGLLSLEDYGISATFVLALTIIDMFSEIGMQQQMVQSGKGNDTDFQAALHGFRLIRGIVNATILVLIAPLLSQFFGHPELTWAYQTVAMIPLIMSISHSDVTRFQRKMQFWPNFVVNNVPKLVSTLLVWPLYLVLPDYRLTIALLLVQGMVFSLSSFLVSERNYRLTLDRSYINQSLRFGWPLLLNGLLMFAVLHGERMIVGRELGMSDLAILAMSLSLTLTPVLALSNSAHSFFFPQLSARSKERGTFLGLSSVTLQGHFVLTGLTVTGISLMGGPFLHVLLGDKYAASIPLLVWLAMMQGLRLAASGCSTVAIAQGITSISMLGSLPRALLLPLAWYLVATGGSLTQLIWLGILGEALGFAIVLGLGLRRLRLAQRPLIYPLLAMSMVFVGAMFQGIDQLGAGEWRPNLLAVFVMLVGLGTSYVTSRDLRAYIAKREVHRYDE